LKVAVDLTSYHNYTGRPTGHMRYLTELLPRLRAAGNVTLELVVTRHQWARMDFPHELEAAGCGVRVLGRFRQVALNRLGARLDSLVDASLIFAPVNYARPAGHTPVVCVIHDLLPYTEPDYFAYRKQSPARYRRRMRSCARLVAISEFTARQAREYLDVDPDRVAVIPNGVSPPPAGAAAPPAALRDSEPFFLALGGAEPRKNAATAVAAYRIYRDRGGTHRLVLVGSDHGGHRVADILAAAPDGVVSMRRVSEGELDWLYRNAVALVFPSRHEGFGFPPLEAMARGCATLAADCTALPEVLGDGAELIDPDDPKAWAGAMQRCAADAAYRADLGRRGLERSRLFSWDRTAGRYLALFRDAAGATEDSV